MNQPQRRVYLEFLDKIDFYLDGLEKFDRNGGYGDFVQNFEDAYRTRITQRLRNFVLADIKRHRPIKRGAK